MNSNRDLIEAHYAAGEVGDVAGMFAVFADDIVWTEAEGSPVGGTYVGTRAVAEIVFGTLKRDWDAFAVAIDELLDAGDTIVALGTYTGTYKTTGKSFQARVAHVWQVRNGKAVRFEQITDTAEMQAAMA